MFRQFFYSMRFKMMATYLAVILSTLLLMSIYILGLLSENLYDSEVVDLFAKANVISDTVVLNWEGIDTQRFEDITVRTLAGTNIRGVITNTAYTVLYDTNAGSELQGKIFMRDVIKASLEGEQTHLLDHSGENPNMLSVAVPIENGGTILGAVYLTTSVENIGKTIRSIQMSLIIFSVLISVLVGMLSLGMSYIVTSPIEEFMTVAREISKGNFSKRIKVKGNNEISQMGETLNYMCEELELLEEKRRKFVSDASHELKTPMATIKLICDSIVSTQDPDLGMVKEFLKDLSDEVDRLTRIIERLLALTRLDDAGNSSLKLEVVNIKSLIRRIVKKLTPIAEAKEIVLSTEFDLENMQNMMLDYDKIWEALYNIIDNGIKYSPEGGFVNIDVSGKEAHIIIRIEDNGPGIPENEKERIFERFYRLDDSRARDTGGTGLGLSIAKEAIVMHGGRIDVTANGEVGSLFTILLPYIPAEDSL